jgi:hypothetical protein
MSLCCKLQQPRTCCGDAWHAGLSGCPGDLALPPTTKPETLQRQPWQPTCSEHIWRAKHLWRASTAARVICGSCVQITQVKI